MLMRFVDVPLDEYPMLRWQSLIGQGIVSPWFNDTVETTLE